MCRSSIFFTWFGEDMTHLEGQRPQRDLSGRHNGRLRTTETIHHASPFSG